MKKYTQLASLGFDEKTEKVYRALLRLGDSPASGVAKITGIKRTSVYHILEQLVSTGLASTYLSRGTKRYAAENPNKLKTYFEQKAIIAERLIPDLQKEIQKNRNHTMVRFLEGKEAIKSISEEALESKQKIIFTIGSSKQLLSAVDGKYGFGARRRSKRISMRSLRLLGDEQSTHPDLHTVRFLKKDFDFPGFIIIFDNTVGIIPFENEANGFVVTSKAFSKMLRSIFESLWQQS
jgi:sugar-specific transcriptional regulator TrmB